MQLGSDKDDESPQHSMQLTVADACTKNPVVLVHFCQFTHPMMNHLVKIITT